MNKYNQKSVTNGMSKSVKNRKPFDPVQGNSIGLGVHKESIAVAIADNNGGSVRYFGEIKHTPEAVEKWCK